jgi:ribosome hibernation promoting factor
MKLTYSGKTKEFTPELEEKVGVKLAKLGKMVEQRGEREAHVTHHVERHLHKTEIVMKLYDHSLIGEGADPDLATALTHAIDNIEKQIVKLRNRWRDTHRDARGVRDSKENWTGSSAESETQTAGALVNGSRNGASGKAGNGKPKVFRVDYDDGRKPMTLEEALLEMEKGEDYVVYRDLDASCVSVLVRRPDGHYDLIQS